MAGVLAAIGGAQLSLGELGSFVERMTAGNGFIALAVLILSRWKPLPLIITSLFFGFARAFSESLELMIPSLPSDLILMIPFVITIIVMGGLGKQTVVPGALGKKIA
jgi:simple sugar transport system permease protein